MAIVPDTNDHPNCPILVTGGSGFLGAHCVAAALRAGHRVRTTVRDPARGDEVRRLVAAAGVEPGDRLEVAVANLDDDHGWGAAVDGCDVVLHVASPFQTVAPEDEDALIAPAREGTLRVLRAALQAGVRRVVLTSSFAAIGYGHRPTERPFGEDDWTDVDGPGVTPYIKSKTLAERAAWDFKAAAGSALELVVLNPVAIFGPALGPRLSESIQLIAGLLTGALKEGAPDIAFGLVDVRDLADLHLRAAVNPDTDGRRFLVTAADAIPLLDVAGILRDAFPERAALLPDRALPGGDGHVRHLDGERARHVLGFAPRPIEETLRSTAESLFALGLVD